MANLTNVGTPQVAVPTYVAEAISAGIDVTIRSLVHLATDRRTLLEELVTALEPYNAPLAASLNTDTLDAILRYMEASGGGLVLGNNIPDLLDADGPEAIWPVYYPDTDTLVVGWQDANAGDYARCYVTFDQVVVYDGPNPAGNIEIPGFVPSAGVHSVGVCWVDDNGDTTRLTKAEVTV